MPFYQHYECGDCKQKTGYTGLEARRATRIKCMSCGSIKLTACVEAVREVPYASRKLFRSSVTKTPAKIAAKREEQEARDRALLENQ